MCLPIVTCGCNIAQHEKVGAADPNASRSKLSFRGRAQTWMAYDKPFLVIGLALIGCFISVYVIILLRTSCRFLQLHSNDAKVGYGP